MFLYFSEENKTFKVETTKKVNYVVLELVRQLLFM